ncbi:MAG TPA: NUDIX hydrolase [Kofleriaceae bacterium]|nr:NUDIX hydrolase [Kofleriaceae bacterium]
MSSLREASAVILLRRVEPAPASGAAFEVFLVRRRKGASFMASAFVFPGGGADPGEDARTAAARELFEEAGVLLARDSGKGAETLKITTQEVLRRQILGGANAEVTLDKAGLAWSTDTLVPWSHWITPSIEPRRFSARFFVCELPSGQDPHFDDIETVEEVWIRPADALARAGELALPPPQVRTCWELAQLPTIEAVIAEGRARADEPHPILPRLSQRGGTGGGPCLLLPWDPEYVEGGTGDAAPLTYQPRWARGPSRFIMEDRAWKHVGAPGSTSAG